MFGYLDQPNYNYKIHKCANAKSAFISPFGELVVESSAKMLHTATLVIFTSVICHLCYQSNVIQTLCQALEA